MNEKTSKLEDIFHAACELSSAEELDRYLKEACAGDEELRREVEGLLAAIPAGAEFFKSCEEGAGCFRSTVEQTGSTSGRYKLLEKIGEGGMGVVYMAEQLQPIRRKVAFKMIKLGMDTEQVIARFEAERQALAMMDHPHIAQALDAGATETGRPFFVMELVEGIAITKFCDANKVPTEARLKLFITVCRAIQSAHQKGIIHRDIKPSNVLVAIQDGVAHPMVIDFGVARAINQKLTNKTVFTRFAAMIGTPAYMSPEQAEMNKSDIDTRSDIYSLGVLLYELLTGTTPFREEEFCHNDFGEMQRIIAQEEPERPSTRLKKQSIMPQSASPNANSEIDSDLDWIVMKCLEKDRRRRYETAAGLAADVQAYLGNQPVTARPPSRGYRFHKFIQRNRAASLAGGTILLSVVLAAVISLQALLRERAARRQSEERLKSALSFVEDVFGKVAPHFRELPGATKAQEELGQAGLTFLENLRKSSGENPALRAALARLFVRLSDGENTGNSNSGGDFQAGFDAAYKAIELLNADPAMIEEPERTYLLAWAKFNVTQCLYAQGRIDEALAYIEQLDSHYKDLEHFAKFDRGARRDQQSIRNNAGYNLILAGRAEEAIERFLLPVLKSDWARTITTNSAGYELETMMNANGNLATAHYFLQQFDAMRPLAQQAVRLGNTLVERFPLNGGFLCKRAANVALQGYAALRTGTDEGLDILNNSREEIEKLIKSDAKNELFRLNRAVITSLQASAYANLSRRNGLSASERVGRLKNAEMFLAQATEFANTAKTKEPTAFVMAAERELEVARAELKPRE